MLWRATDRIITTSVREVHMNAKGNESRPPELIELGDAGLEEFGAELPSSTGPLSPTARRPVERAKPRGIEPTMFTIIASEAAALGVEASARGESADVPSHAGTSIVPAASAVVATAGNASAPAVPAIAAAVKRVSAALQHAMVLIDEKTKLLRQPAWCDALSPLEFRVVRGLLLFICVLVYGGTVVGIWQWSVAADRRRALASAEFAGQHAPMTPAVPVASPPALNPSAPLAAPPGGTTALAPAPLIARRPSTMPVAGAPATPPVTPSPRVSTRPAPASPAPAAPVPAKPLSRVAVAAPAASTAARPAPPSRPSPDRSSLARADTPRRIESPPPSPARPPAVAAPTSVGPPSVDPGTRSAPRTPDTAPAVAAAPLSGAAPVAAPIVTPPLPSPAAEAPSARPAALTAATSVDPLAADRAAVNEVLASYRRSYNSLDAAGASAIWQGVDTKALQRAFSTLSRQTLAFDRCEVRVPGEDRAVARCDGMLSYVPKFGDQAAQQRRMTWNIDLRRSGERWMIVGVNAR